MIGTIRYSPKFPAVDLLLKTLMEAEEQGYGEASSHALQVFRDQYDELRGVAT
jgi:hypothetical protein